MNYPIFTSLTKVKLNPNPTNNQSSTSVADIADTELKNQNQPTLACEALNRRTDFKTPRKTQNASQKICPILFDECPLSGYIFSFRDFQY
jgi:hypothetical protein